MAKVCSASCNFEWKVCQASSFVKSVRRTMPISDVSLEISSKGSDSAIKSELLEGEVCVESRWAQRADDNRTQAAKEFR